MKNKINVLTALICAFALSVVSLNFVEAATGTSGFTYKSQGRIVYDGGTPETSDDVIFDASDFSTIDQMVVDGKNSIKDELRSYDTVTTLTDDLPAFADLTNAINNLTNGTNATAGQILSGQKALVGKNLVTGEMPNNGALNKSDLAAGASFTIPAGYTTGGTVTAKSLASQTSATAVAGDILNGKTAYVNGNKITGTMTDQGAKSQSLNAGGSYTIPAGYHNGQGVITANSLASQTNATAGAGDILSGKTAWVNGSLVTGTIANRGAISGTISPGSSKFFEAGYYSGGSVSASACTSTHLSGQSKSYTPTSSGATLTPDSGYNGLTSVTISGDSDLIAENIKSGVNIFGVEGSLNSSSGTGEIIQVPSENYIYSKTYDFTPRFVSIFQVGESNRFAATYCSDYATDKYMIYWGGNTGVGETSNPGSNVTALKILGISGNTVYVYMNAKAKKPAYLIVSS